jgi:hypothetical protein
VQPMSEHEILLEIKSVIENNNESTLRELQEISDLLMEKNTEILNFIMEARMFGFWLVLLFGIVAALLIVQIIASALLK